MTPKPPLYRQETDYSCAPACLRMVLESFGVVATEQSLRELSDCTLLGTEAFALVEAAQKLGLKNTRKYNLDFDELKAELERGLYPIVYLRTRLSVDAPLEQHAIVLVEINTSGVQILDPMRGELSLEEIDFQREWGAMRRLTILVE